MLSANTKKDVHIAVEIHYNTSRHEHTPRGGGASEGCRPKLPRWPFSGSGCIQAWGTCLGWEYSTRAIPGESSFLCGIVHFWNTGSESFCGGLDPVSLCIRAILSLRL
jgi:hypothetical protein